MDEEAREETVVELERETVSELRQVVRELGQMVTLYRWNTLFTFFGAVAGLGAMLVVLLVWLM